MKNTPIGENGEEANVPEEKHEKLSSGDKAVDAEIDKIIEKGLFASPPRHYIRHNHDHEEQK